MEGFDYPMGNVQMVGKSQAPMYKGEKPLETKLAPMFALNDIAGHAVDFWLSTEDLPDPNNRVIVDKQGKVTLSYTHNNQVPQQKLYDKLNKPAAGVPRFQAWGGMRRSLFGGEQGAIFTHYPKFDKCVKVC